MTRTAAIVSLIGVCLACPLFGQDLMERGEPELYTDGHLEAIGMPVGGIGTGDIWIAGDGSLPVWQIFNNLTESARIPDSFFAVRAAPEGGEPVLYALQEQAPEGFAPLKVASFQGPYPFGLLKFQNASGGALPVELSLEAFNPMIPLDLKDSALPCALFRITARNTSSVPVEVSFAAMMQNAVGYDGYGEVDGVRFWGYGVNQNQLVRAQNGAGFFCEVMDKTGPRLEDLKAPLRLLHSGPKARWFYTCENLDYLRLPEGGPAPEADAVWIKDFGPDSDARLFQAVARVHDQGGALLLENPSPVLFERVEALRAGQAPPFNVFADFEGQDYGAWKTEGDAFGKGPSHGTEENQNPVSGFMGQGLVNSYPGSDAPKGILVSPPFKVAKRFIGFLVGGGAHEGGTCVRLRVDGEVVCSATGKNSEVLEPAQWDVSAWIGREAVIEIVDDESGGWGHINVDQIVFGDEPPLDWLGKLEGYRALADSLPNPYKGDKTDFKGAGFEVISTRTEVIEDGEDFLFFPALVKGALGKGTVFLHLLPEIAVPHGLELLAQACGGRIVSAARGIPKDHSFYGTMALATRATRVSCLPDWTEAKALAADLADDGRLSGRDHSGTSPMGTTINCALAVPASLAPGEEAHADFILSWSFPNLERYGHTGNAYARDFPDAWTAAAYVLDNYDRLREGTQRYVDTLYETNLPYWMLDAIGNQSCIFRTPLCFFADHHKDAGRPYFAGYEGCYGCCPLNCTHVWNYAQTLARLYPELGRNLRWFDFNFYLKPDGETQHRQHTPTGAFIDGQCAVILGALREHQLSTSGAFLAEIWPGVKKAVEWLIRAIDPDEDGVNGGLQWNTYDVATSGAHTFIGSQYLAALAAGEEMARFMGDQEAAERWARIREAGSKNQDELLWNGEYFIQKPDEEPGRDYDTGCHTDQLVGQWWARMLDLGNLYPEEHVRAALESIYRYNLRRDFAGFEQRPRRYAEDTDGGLLICTWPKGGRPDPFIEYADEVWTGLEYEAGALMVYEGLAKEGFDIVKTARARYDGRLREGFDSGPGGNPFCDLECGRFYARALSSWSLLLAAQGFLYNGPEARIGFLPRFKPEDHKSFFSAADGWGLYSQQIDGGKLTAKIELRRGTLEVKEIVTANVGGASGEPVQVKLNGTALECDPPRATPERLTIRLKQKATLKEGDTLTW